ncbi:MAG: flagellar hook protein FlgE [Deltaproteobacteria bacterium]|nr:flagellar hook protein FlgE [Deltaproteobacteria bacterium]
MLSSLYTGISGLSTYGNAMSVIGNNIANVNTTGFKASRVSFADLYNMALTNSAVGQLQVGRGVRMSSIDQLFTQGSLENTGSATDMAIQGDGFFIVSDGSGTYYTRAGHFIFDSNGRLVNPEGYTVQGWTLNTTTGLPTGPVGDLTFTTTAVPASATQNSFVAVNLDSNSTANPGGAAFDPTSTTTAENTSNYSTSFAAYDSLGNSHVVTLYFRKTAANTWSWYGCVDGGEITGGTAGQLEIEAQGTLSFTTSGALDNHTTTASDFDFTGAAQNQSITFDFGTSITGEGGTGVDGTTQFAGDSTTYMLTQDGYASGLLQGLIVDDEGIIVGRFSNGQTQNLAQIALGRFPSPWGLEAVGSNLFVESNDSGQPLVNAPGTSGLGKIASNALEMSNVDLAGEFVKMIRTQQAFTANSKIITTTDQMLTEVVNLKR